MTYSGNLTFGNNERSHGTSDYKEEGRSPDQSGDGKGYYQFASLSEIINNFMLVYVGENKILNKVNFIDVQFHAMRAFQELTYDVMRSYKTVEVTVRPSLTLYLPEDYVNYCKIVRVDSNGIEKPIYPTGRTSNPFPLSQDANGDYTFSGSGAHQFTDETISGDQIHASKTRDRFNSIPSSNSNQDYDALDHNRLDNRGRRYGLDPQHAQQNGTFYIDKLSGMIHFSSDLAGELVILKYISDGLGTPNEMIIHKFCEEAIYKHVMYGLVSGRSNIPNYIVERFKKERFAETRKAKIRLSNIKIEEFTQVLRGLSKPIK